MKRAPIEDLVHRYADAVVHRDEERWAATWAEDAVWELGRGNRVEGREAIAALWNSAMDGFAAVVQNVVNGTYELDDEAGTGTGRWYVIEGPSTSSGRVCISSPRRPVRPVTSSVPSSRNLGSKW